MQKTLHVASEVLLCDRCSVIRITTLFGLIEKQTNEKQGQFAKTSFGKLFE